MNAGADVATGDVLCFLHADTRLPEGFADAVRHALADSDAVAAAFDFSVDAPGWRAALVSTLGTLRWRLTRLPYGDQALCVPRHVFDALGGFPDIPAMEDYELALRLRRFGKIRRVALRAATSNRSWEKHGLWSGRQP